MGANSNLELLAQGICRDAKAIEAYRTQQGLPHLSFDSSSEPPTVHQEAPQAVHEARQAIIDNASQIQRLVLDPADIIPALTINYQQLICIQWLCRFHVVSCVPLMGSVSYAEAASLCSVPEDQLRSVARMAIATNFLREIEGKDELAHNSMSAAFVRNPGLADWALFVTQFSMPVAGSFADATKKWGSTKRKDETAMNLALKTDLPLFDFIKQSPEITRQFAAYMRNVQQSDGMSVRHLVNSYDWAALGEATVIDIGGSTGAVSVHLANMFPQLRFIVRDLHAVTNGSSGLMESQPEHIRTRIEFQAQDFFEPQPAERANVFLMRMILHDWPKDEAVKILRNIVPALKASGRGVRLLIQDTVLPIPGSVSSTQEALLRVRDLTMIQSFNSKERELAEFVKLLNLASSQDARLVLKGVHTPAGSLMSVLEVAYEQTPNGDVLYSGTALA
ncbi:hypothetical protein EKO04_010533 [Ascochyta lentis]|uniref:O-methyltransferase C-terminal domain-containing protein n=1 Tax=Ascochyta lentis TaxID=205686 RepID=A0A8H7IUS8_9PLEO|nr:hypothetical protein EKO04_010533 [Ascochyta lentis]